MPPQTQIFEIGSGTGADATRIEQRGFVVQRSDVTPAFVELLRQQDPAAFLHFTLDQFRQALTTARQSLLPGGFFCMGMKLGKFEGWREKGLSGKRYFKFWQTADLESELLRVGFTVKGTIVTPDESFAIITAQLRSKNA